MTPRKDNVKDPEKSVDLIWQRLQVRYASQEVQNVKSWQTDGRRTKSDQLSSRELKNFFFFFWWWRVLVFFVGKRVSSFFGDGVLVFLLVNMFKLSDNLT